MPAFRLERADGRGDDLVLTPSPSTVHIDPILVTLIWVVVILAVFAPLGVRRYRSMSR